MKATLDGIELSKAETRTLKNAHGILEQAAFHLRHTAGDGLEKAADTVRNVLMAGAVEDNSE